MSDFLNFRVIPQKNRIHSALALEISKSIDASERLFLIKQMWEDDIKAVATIVGTYFRHNKRYNCSGCPALDIILTKIIASLSVFRKSSQFINSFLGYSRF